MDSFQNLNSTVLYSKVFASEGVQKIFRRGPLDWE